MQRLKKLAFLATGCTAVSCLAAQIMLAAYLGAHRPNLPRGVYCYELKGFGGLVFVTQAERTITSVLTGVWMLALFLALLLHISMKAAR